MKSLYTVEILDKVLHHILCTSPHILSLLLTSYSVTLLVILDVCTWIIYSSIWWLAKPYIEAVYVRTRSFSVWLLVLLWMNTSATSKWLVTPCDFLSLRVHNRWVKTRGENNMLTWWAINCPPSKLFCLPSKLLPKIAHPVNYCALKILGKKKNQCINIYHDGAFDGAFASKLKIKKQFF